MHRSDILIIGGGIVGLATAYYLAQIEPEQSLTILEKESELAFHQTGRNSGVIHSGIYYKPGSLKAQNCRRGKALLEQFCRAEAIPYDLCGKVIVATRESELSTLQMLYERGQANGVHCKLIGRPRLLELEPHVSGIKAIHVPESGITDYIKVCQRLAHHIQRRGNEIRLATRVTAIRESASEIIVETNQGDFGTRYLVNCAGLFSDRIVRLAGSEPPAQVVPFRGEYFELEAEAEHLCRSLIYPVPDPAFPFLGVHFTRMIQGGVECGPNAVLAFAREGYRLGEVNGRDLWETLSYSGFHKLAGKYWRTGLGEMWRSASKQAFVQALQKLIPEIRAAHLRQAPAGVRAQVVRPNGTMIDDFTFATSRRMLHVVNAPSPAATASLSIGRHVAEQITLPA